MIRKCIIVALSMIILIVKGQNPVNYTFPTTPTPSNATTPTYTRATSSINLKNGFKYGFISGGANNLLNLNISSQPNFISNDFNTLDNPFGNCQTSTDFGKPVGETQGNLSVSNTGGAVYTIPIFSSPGTNDVSPKISMYYDSQSGFGELGYGFHLSGLSQITRCGKIPINDGTYSGVELSINDYYSLDGNRLILKTGTYGSNNSTYATEMESFGTITGYSQGTILDWFEIKDKLGNTIQYGNTADSKLTGISTSNTNILTWKINRITDEFGNYMDYHYKLLSGETVIDKIEYTGNQGASLSPYNSLEFVYIPTPDKTSLYINGVKFNKTQLLKSIICRTEGQVTHRYFFNYDWQNNKTILTSIQEIDANGRELNPTNICWDDLNQFSSYKNNQAAQLFSNSSEYNYLNSAVPADIDGDGFTDMVCLYEYPNSFNPALSSPKVKVLRNSFMSNYGSTNLNVGFSKIYDDDQAYFQISDYYNGPGKILGAYAIDDDLDNAQDVYTIIKPRTISNDYQIDKISLSSSTGFISSVGTYTLASSYDPNFTPSQFFYSKGDFTGDGENDVLRIDPENIKITSLQGNLNYSISSPSILVRPIEFNGDGIPEFIFLEQTSFQYVDIKIMSLVKGTNTLALTQSYSTTINFGSSVTNRNLLEHITTGDFNDDGNSDIVCLSAGTQTLFVMYSDGLIFQPQMNITSFTPITPLSTVKYIVRASDLNNDGKSDVIITTDQNMAGLNTPNYFTYYFLGDLVVKGPSYSGNFTTTRIQYMDYIPHAYALKGPIDYRWVKRSKLVLTGIGLKADYNGDGYFDAFSINDPQTDAAITNNASGVSNSAVRTILTGLHKRINILYGNLVNEIFLGDGANKAEIYRNSQEYAGPGGPSQTVYTYPLYKYKPNIFCVYSVTYGSGFGYQIQNTTNYIYENAIIHKKGRGFLGFENIFTYDKRSNLGGQKTNDFNNSINVPLNSKSYQLKFAAFQSPKKLVPTAITSSVIGMTENTYSIVAVSNRYFIQLNEVKKDDYINSTRAKTTYTYDLNSAGNIISTENLDLSWTNIPIRTETCNYTYTLNHGTYKLKTTNVATTQQGNSVYTRETENFYDAQGRLSKLVNDPSFGNNSLTTDFTQFNSFGQATVKTTSAGDISTRSLKTFYDSKGRFIVKIENAINNVKEFIYDPIYGNVLEEKDISGLITKMEYDGLGRLAKTTLPNGSVNKITYSWDDPPNYPYLSTRLGVYSILKEVESKPYSKEYYTSDHLLRTETQGLNGVIIADNKYNVSMNFQLNDGTLLETTEPHYDNQSSFLVTQLEYELNFFRNKKEKVYLCSSGTYSFTNLYSETLYSTISTHTVYNEKRISSIDQSGKTTEKWYNSAGQLIKTRNTGTGNTQVAAYNYNSVGIKDIKLTNGLNSQTITTTFDYNSLGQQTITTDPSVGTFTYAYNTIGELITRTEPDNIVWNYSYDLLGRLISKSGPSGTTNFQYVSNNNGKNLIDKIIGPSVTTEFKYDYLSRLIETKETIGTTVLKTNFVLDKYGRVKEHIYPGGFTTKNTYGINNNLVNISDVSNNTIWQIGSQSALGEITNYSYGNGISVDITKTDLHYLKEKTYSNIHTQEYSYDELTGNLKARKFIKYDGSPSLLEKFIYDGTDRLDLNDQVNPTATTQVIQTNNINYDPVGNITLKSDAGTYNYTNTTQPYILTNITNATSNVSLNTLLVDYNDLKKVEQIKEMATNVKQMNFVYGNDEERIKLEYAIGGVPQYTRYYAENYERQETAIGTKEWNYIYSPTGLCAVYYKNNTSSELLYVLTDHLGSPVMLTNTVQAVVEEYSFDAWGRRRKTTDWSYANVSAPVILNRGFTFHEHIDEFALINMNGRVYDPVIGRFIQPDKFIQDPDNLQNYNRYSYALNNPLKYTDNTGHYYIYDDVAVMAVGFMIGVSTHLVQGGQMDEKALLAGLKGAIYAELAWLTFGGSAAVGSFAAAQIGNAIVSNIAPMSLNVPLGNGFSLGVGVSVFSPYGFSPFISGNVGYTHEFGDAYITLGVNFGIGASYNQFTKEQTALAMLSGGAEAGYGDFGLGANTAYFHSMGVKGGANTSQRIGGVIISVGDMNVTYQNDFVGVHKNASLLADGGDRWRTASVRVSYKDFSVGFKVATGDPGPSGQRNFYNDPAVCEIYNGPHADDYRMGTVYIGYQNYQLGWNSEGVRHNIQNKFAHDQIQHGEAKWFRVMDIKPQVYGNNSPYYRYSLW